MAPVLGYWDIRGLAEPIRYLLHYLGVEFEDKRYEFGPEPNYYDCPWTQTEKNQLGLALPNLPYYLDGDVKLTQSGAILRYLSRKHGGLYFPEGNTEEALNFEMMEGHAHDIHVGLAFIAYNPFFEQARDQFAVKVQSQLKAASEFLGEKQWIMGDQLSHIDFLLFEGLDVLNFAYPNCCAEYDNLAKFQERFAALPAVENYRKESKKWPLFSPYAFFGGKGDPPQ